jgi:hypothetical protein
MSNLHLLPWQAKFYRDDDHICRAEYLMEVRGQNDPTACWLCPKKASLTHSWPYNDRAECVMARVNCQWCGNNQHTWVVIDGRVPLKKPA